jgi:hypothetical protein
MALGHFGALQKSSVEFGMEAVGGLMKSVESHGSRSLLFMMKVMMVLYFVRDTHKVVTTLILVTLV